MIVEALTFLIELFIDIIAVSVIIMLKKTKHFHSVVLQQIYSSSSPREIIWRVIGERAKRARHYQGCTNSRWCGIYI